MAYRGAAPMSKLEYGSVLAASLAFLMNRQRDATGLIAFDERIAFRLPAGARPGHLHALLLALERLAAGRALGRRPSAAPARRGARQAQPRRADLRSARRSGAGHQGAEAPAVPRHRRRRVPGAGSERADVPVPAARRAFKDLESADEVTADPRAIRTAYLRELAGLTLHVRPRAARRGHRLRAARHVAAARLRAARVSVGAGASGSKG